MGSEANSCITMNFGLFVCMYMYVCTCMYVCIYMYVSHFCLSRFLPVDFQYIQVNKKFCELKGRNIGIVEKAQETRLVCLQSIADTLG